MGTDFDAADDDWEQLLEFFDSDPILTSETGRKQPSSSTPSPSASTGEPTGSTPRDSEAVNAQNSPQELHPQDDQATEDGDETWDEGDEETSHPGISSCNVRGHEIPQHSLGEQGEFIADLNEETSNFYDMVSDDSGEYCSDEEDVMSLKQRFSTDRPDIRYNVEDNDDQDSDQDVILLSGVGRVSASRKRHIRDLPDNRDNAEVTDDEDSDQEVRLLSGGRRHRRSSLGRGYGSSEGSRDRASKRIRQDGNAGTGWDHPVNVDDLAEKGMDCSQGGFPGDGRGLQASLRLSSPVQNPVEEAAEDGQGCHIQGIELAHAERDCSLERETSPPVTVLGYKIPGPAGALQTCLGSTSHRPKGLTHMEKYCGPNRLSHMPVLASDTLDFREGPWLAAMEFLNNGNHSSRSKIADIRATKGHIPQLVAIINTAVKNCFGDLSVTLKDPTGTVGGTIHRKVLTGLEDGHLITLGAVIIIRKVAVFSPTPFKHYLNITIGNVDQIFGKDTIAPRRREKATTEKDDLRIPGRDHPTPIPGSNDILQMQTATKEIYQSETIAPNIDHSGREGMTDLTPTVDSDERIHADESPGSGARVMKSLPLEDAIDSRRCGATAGADGPIGPPSELFVDARASQDANAKAERWDFTEDVDLLSADDFA